jgi:hypothetical protein
MTAPTRTRPPTLTPARPPARARGQTPRGVRRTGYAIAALVNLALIWLLLVTPGWERLTFLTGAFTEVTGLLTASLVAGVLVNLLYAVTDPPWVKRLGDATTAALACAVLARTWALFPFELAGRWTGWDTALRVALGFVTVATALAVLANLSELLRLAAEGELPPERPTSTDDDGPRWPG